MAQSYPHLTVIDGGRPGRRRRTVGRRVRPWLPPRVPALVAGLALLAPTPLNLDPPQEPPPSCRVLSVTDGDTVRIRCAAGGAERARLVGFDTPELFSPRCLAEYRAAREAKSALSRLIRQADEVSIVQEGSDRYGRALIALFVDGRAVSRIMIDAGHARPYMGGEREGWCSGVLR